MNKKRFRDEEIQIANNKSILDYVNSMNLETKKAGKTLKIEGYGGLYIDPINNRWNCFSANKGGGIIQLVMYLEDKSWKESISSLINDDYRGFIEPNKTIRNKDPKDFILPDKNNTYNHIIAYLIGTRKIDKEIVYKLIQDKKLYEDKNRNCVFVGYDEDKKPAYGGLRGTNQYIPFKGEVRGSQKGFSFNIKGDSKELYVFESPIELMSYMTIYKRINESDFPSNALSLAGTSDIALGRFLKNNDINSITLALDNDASGLKASNNIKEKYQDKYSINVKLPFLKDWNEDLVNCFQKGQNYKNYFKKTKAPIVDNYANEYDSNHEEELEI